MKKLFTILLAVLIWTVTADDCLAVDDPDLQFTQVNKFSDVWDINNAGDGSGRLFLVRRYGRINVFEDGQQFATLFLDITSRVFSEGAQPGLYSMAFAPDYKTSGYFYVFYYGGRSLYLDRYTVSDDPNIAEANSRETIMTVAESQPDNDTSGRIRFGPDGMLYVSVGDVGRNSSYSNNSAQDGSTLLAKLMRIDVDPIHGTYAIPADNPFVGNGAVRDEIWALGLRHVWRFSFDRGTGDIFIADYGPQKSEINFQDARSTGGENYGWNTMEGSSCVLGGCNQAGLTKPVTEYAHNGSCLVMGGEVYRGNAYPNLKGIYLYGDLCSGKIWSLTRDGDQWVNSFLANTSYDIVTFGLGEDGSVYVADWGGGVYLISDGGVKAEPSFGVNAGFNDAWYFPPTSGQGFFIIAWEEIKTMFLAWFTYDVERPSEGATAILGEPGHRWITAQGSFEGATATLDVYQSSGGVFDSAEPAVGPPEKIGTMTIIWTDCNTGVVTYDIPSLGLMGNVPIQRVVTENAALCQALQ